MKKLLILILFIVLMLSSCRTIPINHDALVERIHIPSPEPPEYEPVRFEEKEGGLWLSYDEYRNLETNIIRMKAYIEKLEATIEAYRSVYEEEG